MNLSPFVVRDLYKNTVYTYEPYDSSTWKIKRFTTQVDFLLGKAEEYRFATNISVARDWNYFQSHWHDYDVEEFADQKVS